MRWYANTRSSRTGEVPRCLLPCPCVSQDNPEEEAFLQALRRREPSSVPPSQRSGWLNAHAGEYHGGRSQLEVGAGAAGVSDAPPRPARQPGALPARLVRSRGSKRGGRAASRPPSGLDTDSLLSVGSLRSLGHGDAEEGMPKRRSVAASEVYSVADSVVGSRLELPSPRAVLAASASLPVLPRMVRCGSLHVRHIQYVLPTHTARLQPEEGSAELAPAKAHSVSACSVGSQGGPGSDDRPNSVHAQLSFLNEAHGANTEALASEAYLARMIAQVRSQAAASGSARIAKGLTPGCHARRVCAPMNVASEWLGCTRQRSIACPRQSSAENCWGYAPRPLLSRLAPSMQALGWRDLHLRPAFQRPPSAVDYGC